jgi:hypothetical protein
MKIRLVALVVALGLVSAAYAQNAQNRERLEAPGKVPFGTSYAEAKKIVGPKATTTTSAVRGAKGLACTECYQGTDGPQLSVFFSGDDRMVRAELVEQAPAGVQAKTLQDCLNVRTTTWPELIKRYGQPNRHRWMRDVTVISIFDFKDGGVIEYVAGRGFFGACGFRVVFMTKDGQNL